MAALMPSKQTAARRLRSSRSVYLEPLSGNCLAVRFGRVHESEPGEHVIVITRATLAGMERGGGASDEHSAGHERP